MGTATTAARGTAPQAQGLEPWWLRVRWDRIGRVSLLCVLAGIVLLYIGPARSWLQTWQASKRQRAEVVRLEREHRALSARRQALKDPATLEREARRLGMVKPDERSYVVVGLPR